MEDKNGLDRSVLSYIDVSLQPPGKYYLIVDEGMGNKAMFTCDQLQVDEHQVIAFRDNPVISTVIKFSPMLPWRLINTNLTYTQNSRTVYEREARDNKELHDLTKALRKELVGDEKDDIQEVRPPGQYV